MRMCLLTILIKLLIKLGCIKKNKKKKRKKSEREKPILARYGIFIYLLRIMYNANKKFSYYTMK